MKKLAVLILAIALLIVPMSISASAADAALNDFEKKIIASLDENIEVDDLLFHLPQEYINQAENFLKSVDLTETQAEEILDLIQDCKDIAVADHIHSTSDLKILPQAEKQKLLGKGQAAAEAAGAVLTYNGEDVVVTHNGTTVFEDAPIVKVTGAETDYTALILSVAGVVVALAAAAVVASKKGLLAK